MKTNLFHKLFTPFAIPAVLAFASVPATNAQDIYPDRPGIPYFELPGESIESLPLKSTKATVEIAGVIAHVNVKQVYKNQGNKAIEAIYVFPGSTRAAVHAMSMKIGERTINAVVEERDKARKDYQQALDNGQSAALLEQHRPNVFQMNVGNILPGDVVEVELKYTETLIPREGIYEFLYPTVVGPRYDSPAESNNADNSWNNNPWLNEGELPQYEFGLGCSIVSGMDIKDVRCTSHKTNINYLNKKSVNITLDDREAAGGNRDFILQYRLGGNGIETGVWLYSDGRENYFMASIQPPAAVKPEMIPPREYIFIVDVSGSMFGFPLEVSKNLISVLLNSLKSTDQFNILFFAGGADLLSEKPLPATKDNISKALKMLDKQRGSGGTELLPALKKALSMNNNDNIARSFIVATDGYVTVEKEAFALIKNNLNKASFFTFGIGSSVNHHLLEGMAHAGAGEAFVVTNEKEAKEKAKAFVEYINRPVLTNISLVYKGFEVYDVEPATVPDMFSSRPVVIFGKYRGNPQGSIVLSGTSGSGNYSQAIEVASEKPSEQNRALKYLWAREQIRMIDDYSGGYGGVPEEVKKQVTALGLRYNLLTAYTSFVAIDSEIRNPSGNLQKVKQPLPLPQGVSNQAVGMAYPSTTRMSKCMVGSYAADAVEEKTELAEHEIFTVIEQMAEFPGGKQALADFLKKNLRFPEKAKAAGISGTVYVQFTVNADGSLSDIKVLRGIGYGCDEEAIRLIKLMPGWVPAKQRGKAVKSTMNLPVTFAVSV